MTNLLRSSLIGSILVLGACKSTTPSATPWEIVHGTSTLAASKAVNDSTFQQIVAYAGRSGSITVADDSTLSGWFQLSPADSQHHFTGTVSFGAGDPVMALSGVMPWKYLVITSPDFPSTYALVSDTVLTANLVGDAALEQYRLYWEFHK